MSERTALSTACPPSADPWRAIGGLSSALAALEDASDRLALLRTFACSLWEVEEACFVTIGRRLGDMDERPGKGVAAFWEYVARQGAPVAVSFEELSGLPEGTGVPDLLADARFSSFLLAPVLTPGRVVGVLALATTDPDREWHAEALARVEAVNAQIAGIFDRGVIAEEQAYQALYAAALGEIDTTIASYDVADSLRFGLLKLREVIGAERAMVYTVQPETGVMRLSVAEGCPYARDGQFVQEPCAVLARQVIAQRKTLWLAGDELAGLAGVQRREACGEKQAIAVPLMANSTLYGVLQVFDRRDGRPFHRNEVAFAGQVGAKLALVIQNTHAYLKVHALNGQLEQKVGERTVELEAAIATLQETQAQLMHTEKLAMIGTLAGGVAHEINNPLAAILANVQLLALDDWDDDQRDSLMMIETGALRCKSIVEHLLKYARQATPEHRSLGLHAIIDDALELLAHRLRMGRIDLVRDYGDLPPVIGNATELTQIFTNLAANALDALGEGQDGNGPARLTIRTRHAGRQIVIELHDNGCGIDSHALRRVFDPFFTTKPLGKGTGLGLSISRQLVEGHGGTIEASSLPGDGTTFRVWLPIAHGAAASQGG